MAGEEALAREAHSLGVQAIARLDAHETICSQRWEELTRTLSSVADGQEKLHGRISDKTKRDEARWWTVACSLVAMLVGAVGYLLATYVLKGGAAGGMP